MPALSSMVFRSGVSQKPTRLRVKVGIRGTRELGRELRTHVQTRNPGRRFWLFNFPEGTPISLPDELPWRAWIDGEALKALESPNLQISSCGELCCTHSCVLGRIPCEDHRPHMLLKDVTDPLAYLFPATFSPAWLYTHLRSHRGTLQWFFLLLLFYRGGRQPIHRRECRNFRYF